MVVGACVTSCALPKDGESDSTQKSPESSTPEGDIIEARGEADWEVDPLPLLCVSRYGRLRVCFFLSSVVPLVADCALLVGAIAPVKNSAAIRRRKEKRTKQEQHTTRATHTGTGRRRGRGRVMMAASSSMHSFGWGLTCFFVHCICMCVQACACCRVVGVLYVCSSEWCRLAVQCVACCLDSRLPRWFLLRSMWSGCDPSFNDWKDFDHQFGRNDHTTIESGTTESGKKKFTNDNLTKVQHISEGD